MPRVVETFLVARDAERLTGTTTCPNRSVVGPAGETQGAGPSADTGEEMVLSVSAQIVRLDIGDRSFIDIPWSDQTNADQVA
jgi:hypothetical protein